MFSVGFQNPRRWRTISWSRPLSIGQTSENNLSLVPGQGRCPSASKIRSERCGRKSVDKSHEIVRRYILTTPKRTFERQFSLWQQDHRTSALRAERRKEPE